MKRVIFIIIDSMGIGQAPDAAEYGDEGYDTLRTIAGSKSFDCPNMTEMGLFNIEGVRACGSDGRSRAVATPTGSFARLMEISKGKDTTTGHWELSGIILDRDMPTYPHGFPREVMDRFEAETGRRAICNLPYSGTQVIEDYGREHLETGALIVYTSADSVFQIAAHEDIVPVEELYRYCETARRILTGKHAVDRVIARPFVGEPGSFKRTSGRHDYSIKPLGRTMLDIIKDEGLDVLAVGKIIDIFAGEGITDYVRTSCNADGLERTLEWMKRDFHGLMFVNLVDTDMIYGHRNDIEGYANAVSEIDKRLGDIMSALSDEDLLMISADHGCDPKGPTTDHTREYVPLLMYSKNPSLALAGRDHGTIKGMNAAAATILKYLETAERLPGEALI